MNNDGRGGKPVGRAAADSGRGSGSPARPSRRRAWSSALPVIILALVVGLGGGVAIGWVIGHGGQEAAPVITTTTEGTATTTSGGDAGPAYGVVTVSGQALPDFENGTADAAIGLTIPQVSGTDFAGNPFTITPNGTAKLIVALAHWCPYCQQELPVLTDWYASADLPSEVEVFMLVVFTSPDRSNYPPGPWIAASGWSGPVLVDDETRSIADAFGITSVPYNLFVAADGTVVGRATGGRSADQLNSDIQNLLNP